MRIISAIMNSYWSHAIALQKLSYERSFKFSWILTLTEDISIRILCMRINSAILKFYWSHIIALKNCQMNVLISSAEFCLKQKLYAFKSCVRRDGGEFTVVMEKTVKIKPL